MNGDEKKEDSAITQKQITRNWWLMALRGLAAIAFGVLAFIWPGATILSLVLFFGAFAVVNGILALVQDTKPPEVIHEWAV